MKVKFLDLAGPTQNIKEEFLKNLEVFLNKANFILTDELTQFEKAWAQYVGTQHAIGVSNGADALYLALKACDIKEGDEVITQGNAYNATVTAILRAGAVPRFVDIDPKTLLIDVAKIEELITPKTRAILPVHLYGQASDMESIMNIAAAHKLFVIEDCAQAHGATWNTKKVGSWGDIAAWSFYPTKNLGAFGDAGAITTSNEAMAQQVQILRNLGQTSKNNHTHLGYNMRLDPIQAIVLSLKLPGLAKATQKRRHAGAGYDQLLQKAGIAITPVWCNPNATNVYHLYPVRSEAKSREVIMQALKEKGIDTAIHYPVLVFNQPFYSKELPRDPCPRARAVADSIFSLPLFEDIAPEEQVYVVDSLKAVLS